MDAKIREEALSIVLYRLEILFDTFNDSLNHYIANKETSTTAQFNLICQVQEKAGQEDNNATYEELKQKGCLLTREQMLLVAEKIRSAEVTADAAFKKAHSAQSEEAMTTEQLQDLGWERLLAYSKAMDELY